MQWRKAVAIACSVFCLAAQRPDDGMWRQFRIDDHNEARVPGQLNVSWTIHTHGGFSSSPIVDRGIVYVGNNAGEFFALDARTGITDWTDRFASPLMASPLKFGTTIVVGEGDENEYTTQGATNVGRGRNALVAVDAASGNERWQYALSGTAMPTAGILGSTLVQHDGTGDITALDVTTGALKYVRNVGGFASMSAIAPLNAQRFITTGYHKSAMWELQAGDGSTVWEHDFDARSSGTGDCPPATDATHAYCDYLMPVARSQAVMVGATATMHVYAITLGDGASAWDDALEDGVVPDRNEAAIPLVAAGVVYVGSAVAPVVHAIDSTSGRVLWTHRVHGAVKGGMVVDGDAVYFGDLGGYLWALDRRDGHVIGALATHVPFNVGSPLIYGKTLFIGGQDGTFLAISTEKIRASTDR